MKIGIDARFVGPKGTGIGKYTEKLIMNLQKVDGKNDYFIFLKEDNWVYLKLTGKNFQKVLTDISWYSVEEQIKMPAIFNEYGLDLLHVPHFNVPIFYGKNFIVTIHDLIHQEFATNKATTRNKLIFKFKKIGYQRVMNHAIKNSKKIITPSNFVKEEIMKNYKVNGSKIAVIHEAAEEEYFVNKRLTMNDQRSTILYVGNAYPHKNLNNLLDAFGILTTNLKLVIVCPRDIFWERLKESIRTKGLNHNVKLYGYLKADELKKLFKKSEAYVCPSFSEGFGIPGLNAMAAKVPVVASNIPALKQIYGEAAIYFDPKNPVDIAQKIDRVLKSKTLKEDLIKYGEKQVKKYSWQKMARQTLKIYESV